MRLADIPAKEKWRAAWAPEEVKQLHALAVTYLRSGALNMEAAWKAAEENYGDRINPYFRKALRNVKT